MDPKERWLIKQLHSTIFSGSFMERDVFALLIVLRHHANEKTPVRELSDFVAHREKDRGILLNYLEAVQQALFGKVVSVSLPVFRVEEIQVSFNEIFRSLGLPELDLELANQITVCIISLLQSVQLLKKKRLVASCSLDVGVSSKHIHLFGKGAVPTGHIFMFPMLIAQNNYVPVPPDVDVPMVLDRVVEAYSINGNFRLDQGSELAMRNPQRARINPAISDRKRTEFRKLWTANSNDIFMKFTFSPDGTLLEAWDSSRAGLLPRNWTETTFRTSVHLVIQKITPGVEIVWL